MHRCGGACPKTLNVDWPLFARATGAPRLEFSRRTYFPALWQTTVELSLPIERLEWRLGGRILVGAQNTVAEPEVRIDLRNAEDRPGRPEDQQVIPIRRLVDLGRRDAPGPRDLYDGQP